MKKSKTTDFSINELPKTRKNQFFDILKNKFGTLFSIGLVILLFAIPFFIVLISKQSYIAKASIEFKDEPFKFQEFMKTNTLVFDGFFAISNIVLCIGLSGIYRIFRKLCWGEGIFFFNDFFKGIKQNFLNFLIVSILFSLIEVFVDYIRLISDNAFLNGVTFAILLFTVPLFLMCFSITSIFSNKFVKTIGNAAIANLKKPLIMISLILLPLSISFVKYINIPLIQIIIYLVFFIILSPIYLLISYLFSLSIFDEFTFKTSNPNLYKKGLAYEFEDHNE